MFPPLFCSDRTQQVVQKNNSNNKYNNPTLGERCCPLSFLMTVISYYNGLGISADPGTNVVKDNVQISLFFSIPSVAHVAVFLVLSVVYWAKRLKSKI